MIIDSDEVTLSQSDEVDDIVEQYVLKPVGTQAEDILETDWSDTQPDYIDNPNPTAQDPEYEYWTRQKIMGHDDQGNVNEGFIKYTDPVQDKDLTLSGKTAAMVRQYGDGVLVCRKNKTVGALVNADGSFDVVQVSWNSSGVPTAGNVLASYGSDLMVLKSGSGEQYLRIENLAAGNGVTITETLTAINGDPNDCVLTSYDTETWIQERTITVIRVSTSTDITSTCSFAHQGSSADDTLDVKTGVIIVGPQIIAGETYRVSYISKDSRFRAYSFGRRVTIDGTGPSSIVAGNLNAATKQSSVAIGYKNKSSHEGAIALGSYLKTSRKNQVVVGTGDPYSSSSSIVGNALFGVSKDGTGIFTVNGDTGAVVFRNPSNLNYGYLLSGNDTSRGPFAHLAVYNSSGTRLNYLAVVEDNVVINGTNQYYKNDEEISITTTSPHPGYITGTSTTMRFTLHVDKNLRYVNRFEVTQMKGAIIGDKGYVQAESGTATSHQTDWTEYATINVSKVDSHTLALALTPWTDATEQTIFYNVTNNRPLVYVPSYGGLKIDCYSS